MISRAACFGNITTFVNMLPTKHITLPTCGDDCSLMRSLLMLTILVTYGCAESLAQRKIVVCDIETKIPLRGVAVVVPSLYTDTTDYQGICHLPASFTEATFTRAGYLGYTMQEATAVDTLMLLPAMNSLTEVTIWGKDRRAESIMMFSEAAKAAAAQMPRQSSGASFDFANMLDRRGRRDKAHLKEAKEVLREWDAKK